jgi:hypothetical protein
MVDEKLAADEARRVVQHESVKGAVRENVNSEISREAAHSTAQEHAQAEQLAGSLKNKAVREVATTEYELERGKTVARGSQIVDYLFYLVYGIIALEVVPVLGARQSAGFKRSSTRLRFRSSHRSAG